MIGLGWGIPQLFIKIYWKESWKGISAPALAVSQAVVLAPPQIQSIVGVI